MDPAADYPEPPPRGRPLLPSTLAGPQCYILPRPKSDGAQNGMPLPRHLCTPFLQLAAGWAVPTPTFRPVAAPPEEAWPAVTSFRSGLRPCRCTLGPRSSRAPPPPSSSAARPLPASSGAAVSNLAASPGHAGRRLVWGHT